MNADLVLGLQLMLLLKMGRMLRMLLPPLLLLRLRRSLVMWERIANLI